MIPPPDVLRVRHDRGETTFRLAVDLCAVATAVADDFRILTPAEVEAGAPTRPVYRSADGGLRVATGRVWVRLAASCGLSTVTEALAARGFAVESVSRHAPHTGWVVHADGVTGALHGCDGLRGLPGCEHVEPQLLHPAVRRGSARRPRR